MSDQLYKTMKRKEEEKIYEKRKKEAVYLLGQYVTETNSNEFFFKFSEHLDGTVPYQMKNKIEINPEREKYPQHLRPKRSVYVERNDNSMKDLQLSPTEVSSAGKKT